MAHKSYAKHIDLPSEQVFHNIRNARRFAIDIGGSLAKVAYSSLIKKKSTLVFDEPESSTDGSIYNVSETDEECVRLHFVKFETSYIESCLDFIQANLIQTQGGSLQDKVIKVTGGGAYKYTDLISQKLGVVVDKEDEIECLIKGCNFLLKNIEDESFCYMRHGNPDYKFLGRNCNYPYLLVNIGSGVSFCKVESESKFERIGGTATGGGTFWGLGSLLTQAREFDELLDLAEKGDHKSVDMLVKDIYGGRYQEIGLAPDIIASSFGKAARADNRDQSASQFSKCDIARSLLLCISNDIGQIAYLHAQLHGIKKIYFGGFFIRGHPFTMHTMTYAINFWSKGEIQPMFLRHEGYLGAIGAFLKGMETEGKDLYSWGENLASSSGLASPNQNPSAMLNLHNDFSMLEINRLDKPLLPCPLLLDPVSYFPDTVDLTQDQPAREYWLACFADAVTKTRDLAVRSQPQAGDAKHRAQQFMDKYLDRLTSLKQNPGAFGSLTVRSLLDTSTHFLEECQFNDIFSQQKQLENKSALSQLASRIKELDEMSGENRKLELVLGLLAGNVFDWGARAVQDILESQELSLAQAQTKLQARPWLFDDFDAWSERCRNGPPHKCAAIFCDNSGVDIILGILPFARDLLLNGTNVILCANTRPSINDVVYNELEVLVRYARDICPTINHACLQGRLVVMESGQWSPCLDLRLVDEDLVSAMNEKGVDLIIIEGMGRAVHTNFTATFACDVLKAAVIKNKWLANRFGGDMFSVMFKYERARRISSASSQRSPQR